MSANEELAVNLINFFFSFLFQAIDKAKGIVEADPNRSFVVDVFDAGSNSKVSDLTVPLERQVTTP